MSGGRVFCGQYWSADPIYTQGRYKWCSPSRNKRPHHRTKAQPQSPGRLGASCFQTPVTGRSTITNQFSPSTRLNPQDNAFQLPAPQVAAKQPKNCVLCWATRAILIWRHRLFGRGRVDTTWELWALKHLVLIRCFKSWLLIELEALLFQTYRKQKRNDRSSWCTSQLLSVSHCYS